MNLFKEIRIVKTLAGVSDSTDVYLVCTDYNEKSFTDIQNVLFDFLDEEITGAIPIVEISTELTDNLTYISYMIHQLSVIPRSQINLDLHSNMAYSLNPTEQATYDILAHKKQLYANKMKSDQSQRLEYNKTVEELNELFHETIVKIQTDFGYLITDSTNNWIKNNPIKANTKLF
jgi:hypothetical protein